MDDDCPVAIVTGGARGIGRAIARRLLSDGARVLVIDRNAEAGRSWRDHGQAASFRAGDVTDPDLAAEVTQHLHATYGRLDILVNNAALSRYEPLLDITAQSWREVIETNLSAYFYWAQAAARIMVGQGTGRIINIASVNSLAAEPSVAHYVASKGGVAALTRALAVDLSGHGVTVNAIAPGAITTEANAAAHQTEPLATQLRRVPVGRSGTPEEVADAVAWLAGPGASYVSGHTLLVDGGLLARIF